MTDGGDADALMRNAPEQRRAFLRRAQGGGMMPAILLTAFTLAEARDALKAKKISSQELTDAPSSRRWNRRAPLNAFVTETPEQALAMAEASDARIGEGRGRRAGRPAAGDQGSVLHQGRAHHGGQQHPGQFRAAL